MPSEKTKKPSRHQKHILWMMHKGCKLSAPLFFPGMGTSTLHGATKNSRQTVSISTICSMKFAGWIDSTPAQEEADEYTAGERVWTLTEEGKKLAATLIG